MLKGRKILLAVTGSIAAYKAAILVRLFVKNGASVKVIMTAAAEDFTSSLTLATLSKNEVLTNLFEKDTWANHVMLGRWADVMLVAPASCNTIAKMANGICDNLLSAVYLSATCPVMVAPAMDEDMWEHKSTQKNIATLQSFGNVILPVEDGELASGLSGMGRMAEPEVIVQFIENYFSSKHDLVGKKILITAGPTYEQIDPVRFIGNNSTGKMGIAIAKECAARGGEVHLILGPSTENIPDNIYVTKVKSAEEMYAAAIENFSNSHYAIMSAAVADYTPEHRATEKIKKTDKIFTLVLVKTKDILKKLGELKKDSQTLVGFALETENEETNALKKMTSKNADFIVLNSMKNDGAGFGFDTNKITIYKNGGDKYEFETKSKELVAKDIIDTILKK